MAATPGFARAIAGTGPVVAAFLVPHILAGLTAITSGALVMVSRKGTPAHVRAGTVYFWAITVLAATAAGLTAVRGPRDLPVFLLGVLALALAGGGRHARRHPAAAPWRAWPGHGPHILAMTGSYTVMWTAFLADNARFLPLIGRLPAPGGVLLPAAIAAPMIAWLLHRHRPLSGAGDRRGAGILLVPALVLLFGPWNWRLPGWARWLLRIPAAPQAGARPPRLTVRRQH